MHTTTGPRCGIADYAQALTAALAPHAEIATVPLLPGRLSPAATVAAGRRLSRNDVAHLQHTYSFFGVDALTYTVAIRLLFASIRKPAVLTAHTVRVQGPPRYAGGLGSRLANAVGAPDWHDVETFKRPQAVIVHAALHAERLAARGVSRDRIHIIPPGIPARTAVDPADVAAFQRRFALPAQAQIIGVFGFLESGKRILDLMEAVAGMPKQVLLLVAGGPRLPSHENAVGELGSAADRLGMGDRLRITGYLEADTVPVALEAMDVVSVPYGTDQSVSYSLHRALGQFRPVVAFDLPTFRETQERGGCLRLIPGDNPALLREALASLLEDPSMRSMLSAAAQAYAERASWAAAASRTIQVYHAVRGA
jgi:glycosyltransferase involved in cell wall biosynthesis